MSYAGKVVVSDGYAFVSASYDGLLIYDIDTTDTPDLIGHEDPPANMRTRDAAVRDGYAYVANDLDGGRFVVVDVSDPTAPAEVGSTAEITSPQSVALSGNHAYLANFNVGLTAVNISDVTDPQWVDDAGAPSYAWGVAVSGDLRLSGKRGRTESGSSISTHLAMQSRSRSSTHRRERRQGRRIGPSPVRCGLVGWGAGDRCHGSGITDRNRLVPDSGICVESRCCQRPDLCRRPFRRVDDSQ